MYASKPGLIKSQLVETLVTSPPERLCKEVLGPTQLFDMIQDSLLIQMVKNKVLERRLKLTVTADVHDSESHNEPAIKGHVNGSTPSHSGHVRVGPTIEDSDVNQKSSIDPADITCSIQAENTDHKMSDSDENMVAEEHNEWVYIRKPTDPPVNNVPAKCIACTSNETDKGLDSATWTSDTSYDSTWYDSDDDTDVSCLSEDKLDFALQDANIHNPEMDYTDSVTSLYNIFSTKMEHLLSEFGANVGKNSDVIYIPTLSYLCWHILNQKDDIYQSDIESSTEEANYNTASGSTIQNDGTGYKCVFAIGKTFPTLYHLCIDMLKRMAGIDRPTTDDLAGDNHKECNTFRDVFGGVGDDEEIVPTLYHLCSSHSKQFRDARETRKCIARADNAISHDDTTMAHIDERVPRLFDIVADRMKDILDSHRTVLKVHETDATYKHTRSLRSFSHTHVLDLLKCFRVFFQMERVWCALNSDGSKDSALMNQNSMLQQFAKLYVQHKNSPLLELALKVADIDVNIRDTPQSPVDGVGFCDPNSNNNAVDSLRESDQRSIDVSYSETPVTDEIAYKSYNDNCGSDQDQEAGKEEENTQSLSISAPCLMSTKYLWLNKRLQKGRRTGKSAKSKSPGAVDRTKKRYVLIPMVHMPNEKGKQSYGHSWTDVATVINQGTFNHKNIDRVAAMRHEPLKTISTIYLPSEIIKKRLYAVKPVKLNSIYLHHLLPANAETRLFKENHVKFVCVCLMMAIRFLHENDIYHGTISPKKILFNERGYPLLVGFSSAQEIGGRQSRYREVCPFDYSSPELLYRCTITEATDIFAIGAIAYTMLFGKPPHRAPTNLETRRNILDAKYIPPFSPDEISSRGRKFLLHCLRQDDEYRFSLLHGHGWNFEYIPWLNLSYAKEETYYKQSLPSPIAKVI